MKVYYLDDEIALCEIFEEFISDDRTTVETFTDSNDAIMRCETDPPDMIFIDYRLADTSGDKVARMLDSDIIKFLVTGELIAPDNALFLEVIPKPYNFAQLKQTIESCRDKICRNTK